MARLPQIGDPAHVLLSNILDEKCNQNSWCSDYNGATQTNKIPATVREIRSSRSDMSDALLRMAAYLIQAEKWTPDRNSVQREKTCTRCHMTKHLEKFSFAGAICKTCRSELALKWKKEN